MIACTIKKWAKDNIIQHTSTVWELSRTKDMTDIIETVTHTLPNPLNVFISQLEVPPNTSYYVRATRKFQTNPAADHSLSVLEVRDHTPYLNNLILPDFVKIDKPYIYINEEDFKDNDAIDFEVSTSKFRSKEDGHSSTHWIVTTQDNEILFSSLYDKFNKTSIRIAKSQDILNRTQIKIIAIHVGTNGIESEPGVNTIINNDFSFDLNGMRHDVLPYSDLELTISPKSSRQSIQSVYLTRQDLNQTSPQGINITPNINSNVITVPGQELSYNSKYYLDIYCYTKYGEYTSRRFPITVRGSKFEDSIIDYTYEQKVEVMNNNLVDLNIPNGFTSYELVNGNLLLPLKGSNKLSIFKIKPSSTVNGTKVNIDFGPNNQGYGVRNDIALSSTIVDNILIRFVNNELLLIDNYNTNNKPTFLVYQYDRVTDRFTFFQECERPNEVICMGNTNNIIQINDDEFWYLVPLDNKIMSYKISTNSVKEIKDLNSQAFNKASFYYNRILNRIFLFDNNLNGYILDRESLELKETSTIPFVEWTSNVIKPIELRNGDYLFFNIETPNSNNSIAYYNSKTNKFKKIENNLLANSNFAGTITTLYNDILALSYVGNQTNKVYTNRRVY